MFRRRIAPMNKDFLDRLAASGKTLSIQYEWHSLQLSIPNQVDNFGIEFFGFSMSYWVTVIY